MLFSGQGALILVALLLGSYFLGNISFAKVLSKLRNDDITRHGSGNPGTINMLRTHGILLGMLTLLLDGAKGALPALAAWCLFGGTGGGLTAVYATHLVGFMAVVGHIFPVLNKFKGGKGVATAFGYFTVINPLASAVMFVVGLLIFVLTKIASLGTLSYIAGFIVWQLVINFNSSAVYPMTILLVTATLIFVSHRSNMKKFLKRQESKFNFYELVQKDKDLILNSAKKAIKSKNQEVEKPETTQKNVKKDSKQNKEVVKEQPKQEVNKVVEGTINQEVEEVVEGNPKQKVSEQKTAKQKNKKTGTKSGAGKK